MPPPKEGSGEVRKRVAVARKRQAERFEAMGLDRVRTNAECSGAAIEDAAGADAQAIDLLRKAAETFGLSARGYYRTLRVARTLADLEGAAAVARAHIAEALSYRGETAKQRAAA